MTSSPIEPLIEDSEDLTDFEVLNSIETTDEAHWAALIARETMNGGFKSIKHELKRRRPHLYSKTYLKGVGIQDKVLLFRIDWLQRGQTYVSRT